MYIIIFLFIIIYFVQFRTVQMKLKSDREWRNMKDYQNFTFKTKQEFYLNLIPFYFMGKVYTIVYTFCKQFPQFIVLIFKDLRNARRDNIQTEKDYWSEIQEKKKKNESEIF